jgi:hypothetical protein
MSHVTQDHYRSQNAGGSVKLGHIILTLPLSTFTNQLDVVGYINVNDLHIFVDSYVACTTLSATSIQLSDNFTKACVNDWEHIKYFYVQYSNGLSYRSAFVDMIQVDLLKGCNDVTIKIQTLFN